MFHVLVAFNVRLQILHHDAKELGGKFRAIVVQLSTVKYSIKIEFAPHMRKHMKGLLISIAMKTRFVVFKQIVKVGTRTARAIVMPQNYVRHRQSRKNVPLRDLEL